MAVEASLEAMGLRLVEILDPILGGPVPKRRKLPAAAKPEPPVSLPSSAASGAARPSLPEFLKGGAFQEFQKLSKDRYVMDSLKPKDPAADESREAAVQALEPPLSKLLALPAKKDAVANVVQALNKHFSEYGSKMTATQRLLFWCAAIKAELKSRGVETVCKKEAKTSEAPSV
jgi:anti-sigma factor RsiW